MNGTKMDLKALGIDLASVIAAMIGIGKYVGTKFSALNTRLSSIEKSLSQTMTEKEIKEEINKTMTAELKNIALQFENVNSKVSWIKEQFEKIIKVVPRIES